MKLKRILCPTDFSQLAEEALEAAASLARDYSAELLVVHVVESLPFVPGSAPNPISQIKEQGEDLEADAAARLRALITKVIPPGIPVSPLVESGQPAPQIVALAEALDADLIVMATHGLTGWRKAFLGSVTERVVKLTTKQMLLVKTKPAAPAAKRA
jgi:nucleotide-binding universal stress UspA family protein